MRFKDHLNEMPYISVTSEDTGEQTMIDLELEKELERGELTVYAKNNIKNKLSGLLLSTEADPYIDKHENKFFVSSENKVQDIISLFDGIMNQPFDEKIKLWTPYLFMMTIDELNRKKELKDKDVLKIFNHINSHKK